MDYYRGENAASTAMVPGRQLFKLMVQTPENAESAEKKSKKSSAASWLVHRLRKGLIVSPSPPGEGDTEVQVWTFLPHTIINNTSAPANSVCSAKSPKGAKALARGEAPGIRGTDKNRCIQ